MQAQALVLNDLCYPASGSSRRRPRPRPSLWLRVGGKGLLSSPRVYNEHKADSATAPSTKLTSLSSQRARALRPCTIAATAATIKSLHGVPLVHTTIKTATHYPAGRISSPRCSSSTRAANGLATPPISRAPCPWATAVNSPQRQKPSTSSFWKCKRCFALHATLYSFLTPVGLHGNP